jgi:hypothetical protein
MKKRITALALALATMGALLVPASPAQAATATVCAGNVPYGWLKINDHWDPTRCGSPTAIVNNVWTIETWYDKPVGYYMWVCAGWQPYGWGVVTTRWDPTMCGHPTAIYDNVWLIRRVW